MDIVSNVSYLYGFKLKCNSKSLFKFTYKSQFDTRMNPVLTNYLQWKLNKQKTFFFTIYMWLLFETEFYKNVS